MLPILRYVIYLNIVLTLWYSVLSLAPPSPPEVWERLSDESLTPTPFPFAVSSEGWASGGFDAAVCSPGCFSDSPSPSSPFITDESFVVVEDFVQKESDSCLLWCLGSFDSWGPVADVWILLSERFREWERGFSRSVVCVWVCTGAVEWLSSGWLLDVSWLAMCDKSGLKLGVCSRLGEKIEASFGVILSEPLDAPSSSVVKRGISWGEWPSVLMVSFLLL